MVININQAEVFSTFTTKYDRKNILNYLAVLLCLFIFCICVALTIDSASAAFTVMAVYLIATTIYLGYFVVISNNEANNIHNAFPSLQDFGNTIKEGVKYSLGMFALSFIVCLLPLTMILFSFLYLFKRGFDALSILLLLILIFTLFGLFVLLTYFVLLPLQIMYIKSLDFGDFFAFSKLKEFRKQKGSQFFIFFLYSILVNMVISVIASVFGFVSSIVTAFVQNLNFPIYSPMLNLFITMGLYNLLVPNLFGQIARYDVANDPDIEDDSNFYDEINDYEEDV